jgi:hypothetical protein
MWKIFGFRADAPHVCPLELIIQQGLQSPACLQRLGGDVHERIPSMEGWTSQNFSMIVHVLTGLGKIYKDRGPGEVPLPPGPGPGNLLLEGNSLEYSLSGSNPRTNCSSGHHCESSEPTLRSFLTPRCFGGRWGTLAWTVDNATNGHCDFSLELSFFALHNGLIVRVRLTARYYRQVNLRPSDEIYVDPRNQRTVRCVQTPQALSDKVPGHVLLGQKVPGFEPGARP